MKREEEEEENLALGAEEGDEMGEATLSVLGQAQGNVAQGPDSGNDEALGGGHGGG